MKGLLYVGGVRSFDIKLSGKLHAVHFKTKSPAEIAAFAGAERRYPDNSDGDLLRERTRASFLATSICDEAGSLSFESVDEAMNLPNVVKLELCNRVIAESGKTDLELGKG